MIVCDSSDQARELYKLFEAKKEDGSTNLTASLILSDKDDKETREKEVDAFKDRQTDFLIVYNMLLTGFNAPRLKKLYLGRVIKAHNLLQALTRVNRPYNDFRFGYIVAFANITKEFDKTNRAYFEELNQEYKDSGEDLNNIYGSLFVPVEEIEKGLQNAEIVLAEYDTDNLENFSDQISNEPNKDRLINLAKTLREVKEDYNVARLLDYRDLVEKISDKNVSKLLSIVQDRIRTVNLISNANEESSQDILNLAMSDWTFKFEGLGNKELKLVADDYRKEEKRVRGKINSNWDQNDPEWVDIFHEFLRIMKKQHIKEVSVEETKQNTKALVELKRKIDYLNSKNERLAQAFHGDTKYARTYKKVIYDTTGKEPESIRDNTKIYLVMNNTKQSLDDEVAKNNAMVTNPTYFKRTAMRSLLLNNNERQLTIGEIKDISGNLTQEYQREYEGID